MLAPRRSADPTHARQHVHDIAKAVEFLLPDPRAWEDERLAELDAGNIDALLNAARALPLVGVKAEERDKTLTYFITNAHRMNYARYRALGMFVGSGVIEAGCKTVIGQRLKLSGMHWSEHGAGAILTLRAAHAGGPLEPICRPPHTQTRPADLAACRS